MRFAGESVREEVDDLARDPVPRVVGHDAVEASVRPRGDGGVPDGRDRGQMGHACALERGPLTAQRVRLGSTEACRSR
jgi:hypothetical protein